MLGFYNFVVLTDKSMSSIFFFLPGKVFAFIVGAYYFKYLPQPYRLVLLLIAIASFCDSYGYYLSQYTHSYNAWLYNLYMIVEAWLFGISAICLMNSNKVRRIFFFVAHFIYTDMGRGKICQFYLCI